MPIKFVGVGEKLDKLEPFDPERIVGQILGMGDIVGLVENAQAAVEDDERAEMERRMMQGEFTFDDFLRSYKMLRRMGPLQGVLKMTPGMGKQLERPRRRGRATARARRGDRALDDAAGAAYSAVIDGPRRSGSRPAAASPSSRSTGCSRPASRWRR